MGLGIPASVLGLIVSGDVGGMTIYTDRLGRKIAFPQAPPTIPPTPLQLKHRARWITAVANWNAAAQSTRDAYERASLQASLPMTGHNVWVCVSLTGKFGTLTTLERQTGETLPPPPYVPWPV